MNEILAPRVVVFKSVADVTADITHILGSLGITGQVTGFRITAAADMDADADNHYSVKLQKVALKSDGTMATAVDVATWGGASKDLTASKSVAATLSTTVADTKFVEGDSFQIVCDVTGTLTMTKPAFAIQFVAGAQN